MNKYTWYVVLAAITFASSPVSAQKAPDTKAGKAAKAAKPDAYDEAYLRYLESARHQPVTVASDPGGWMNSLMTDARARHLNDLVTVRVIESITASGKADSSLAKSSEAGVGVPNFLGLEGKLPALVDPASLAKIKAESNFKGAGTTTRTGDLTAVMTARVSEVLPNGDLVIEGVREIEINGDHQVVVLTGVARTADVGPDNVVASTALGQLRIRYYGTGLIKDSLSPGLLVRMLNKIF